MNVLITGGSGFGKEILIFYQKKKEYLFDLNKQK